MPISPDPAASADFVYESISGTVRLNLKARFLTEREMLLHNRTLRERIYDKPMSDPETVKARDELLLLGIVGTKIDELKDKLSSRDLYQLAMGYPEAIDIAEYELGKSRSRPAFIVGTPAGDVAPLAAITNPEPPATPQVETLP